MRPRKKPIKAYIIIGVVYYLFLVFFVAHYTVINDRMMGAVTPGTGIVFTAPAPPIDMSGEGLNALGKLYGSSNPIQVILDAIPHMFTTPFDFDGLVISHMFLPLFWFTLVAAIVLGLYLTNRKLFAQDAPGREKGSAKWFADFANYQKKFVTPWTDLDQKQGISDPNILLATGLKLSMNGRFTKRNINVMAIGGSGTGKTFGLIKPNLAQFNCSFVTTDPSGEIMAVMGIPLQEHGYHLKLFSTSDMRHSNCYNPMDYIYGSDGEVDQTKVGVLVSTFIKNAGELGKKGGGDPFWTKSATAWMTFAVLFLAEFSPIQERNMYHVLRLAQSGKSDEGASSSETALDMIVNAKRKQNPHAACFSSYDTFKLAPAKTANSILISIAVDLNPFSMNDVRNMTTTSYICRRNAEGAIVEYIRDKQGNLIRDSRNLDLDKIGDELTALFINIPQANGAYNFLVSMMYSQLFDTLYSVAEKLAPNRYHIYDGHGDILASEFFTKEDAERMLSLYQKAEVRTVVRDKVPHYYLYNKDAKKETPAEFLMDRKLGKGFLKEVYSEKVGEQFIKRCNFVSASTKKGFKHHTIQKPAYVQKGALRLPIHTRMLLDEFSNIGEIPNFDKMLSTMRKYEISCTIILQSLAQIKAQYRDIWEVLVGNCDSLVFLGSSENETVKYMSEKLGKATIKTVDSSQSKSTNSGSVSNSFKKDGRSLLDPAELAKLDNNYCVVVVRGLDPFFLPKLKFNEHPNFKETGDFDKNKIIGEEYLEDHFRCLQQNPIEEAEGEEDEIENKENYRERNQDKKKQKQKVTTPKGKQTVADVLKVPQAKASAEMKAVTSVPPQEKSSETVAAQNTPSAFAQTFEPDWAFKEDHGTTTTEAAPTKKKRDKKPKKQGQAAKETQGESVDLSTAAPVPLTPPEMDMTPDIPPAPLSPQGAPPQFVPTGIGPENASGDAWLFQ